MATRAEPSTRGGKSKTQSTERVGDVIAGVAKKLGIPAEAALAAGYYESKLNPNAKGDHGYIVDGVFTADSSGPPHSFGVFQLFDLGKGSGMSIAARLNVYKNAMRDLPDLAKAKKDDPSLTWGQAFARSQAPADPTAEAVAVDRYIAAFHASGSDDPVKYFSHLPGSFAGTTVTEAQGGGNAVGGGSSAGGRAGDNNGAGSSSAASDDKVHDWIAALDEAMSPPHAGWNVLKDTGNVLKFVSVRGGLAVVGIVFMGTGLFLMFGREIFGGAVAALAPEVVAPMKAAEAGEAAAARRAAGQARKAATVGA